jgi:hypothetical protein
VPEYQAGEGSGMGPGRHGAAPSFLFLVKKYRKSIK